MVDVGLRWWAGACVLPWALVGCGDGSSGGADGGLEGDDSGVQLDGSTSADAGDDPGDSGMADGTDGGSQSGSATDGSGGEGPGDTSAGSGDDSSDGGQDEDSDGGQDESGSSGGESGGDCSDCPANYICRYEQCIPDLGPCTTHDDCPGDSYCDADGQCIPYGVPPEVDHDPDCQKTDAPTGITPVVQCSWSAPPQGDTETSANVYTTPIVADLNLDQDPDRLQPSIVMTTWRTISGSRIGTLRVFDGRTCEEQMRIGGADDPDELEHRPGYASQWAVADLDGDVPAGGHPEIVGLHRIGGDDLSAYVFEIDVSGGSPALVRRWEGRDCSDDSVVAFNDNDGHLGPSVIDLDDDGYPEVVVDTMVFSGIDGCLLNEFEDLTQYLSDKGIQSVVADVDIDGRPDLVRHDNVAGWDADANAWVTKGYYTPEPSAAYGYTAVVDAGLYSELPAVDSEDLPEIVIVSASSRNAGASDSGSIRLQALDGSIVWGPVPLYQGNAAQAGRGGPPTASDFDGDGQPEFATAGSTFYAVYDPDCDDDGAPAARPGGTCNRTEAMADLPEGVLWAQPSQDGSSNITGSSVFDFDGDGDAEAVYRDECYVRVYDGATGDVVFSAPASNGTGMEFPVIVDVDGDFATEIVVPLSSNGDNCTSPDPLFPESGAFAKTTGFVVLRDPEDRWANSRPIWNQHSYSITHVQDDAVVPKSSSIVPNWMVDGLNNFRQNAQGGLGALQIADLTVEFLDVGSLCSGQSGEIAMQAEVCNRGTAPVQDGVAVEFYEDGNLLCTATTGTLLQTGDCETIGCDATVSGNGELSVIVDPEGGIADCHPGNNDGASSLQVCPQ